MRDSQYVFFSLSALQSRTKSRMDFWSTFQRQELPSLPNQPFLLAPNVPSGEKRGGTAALRRLRIAPLTKSL